MTDSPRRRKSGRSQNTELAHTLDQLRDSKNRRTGVIATAAFG